MYVGMGRVASIRRPLTRTAYSNGGWLARIESATHYRVNHNVPDIVLLQARYEHAYFEADLPIDCIPFQSSM